MSDLQARLQAALGGAYRVEKELGGGGMSRVFVAEEKELGRRVVIKVLPPELAAGVNRDRFRREIQLAASLQHPHIVPLLTAGHIDDLVFYTMPLIEGESLRAKLAREGALPISDAIRIMRDVVDALNYAHRHGVAHRDIKPDNVLISDHHAVVTDFGVAKALGEATGQSSLTSIGVALGTPAYMAPEQAAADPHADHRCDIYAVGALAYEMLIGRPPFTGTSPQAVLAAQVNEPPAPVTKHRATVPPALAEAVMRCLEKNAADRWQTAEELLHLLEAMATPSGGTMPVPAIRGRPAWQIGRVAVGAAGVVVLLALGAVLWRQRSGGTADVKVNPNMVAVFPFRVSGADASLGYLRQGMIDLLAAELTGEGGPRAADPRTVLAAWHRAVSSPDADLPEEAAVGVAQTLGAGQLLLGGVVGTPSRVVLSASLLAVPGGKARAQARVEGPPDSLPRLIDQLTAQLLARQSGEPGPQLATLASASLPALRAYLDGLAAYRRGSYREAVQQFEQALQHDSTFALAALDLSDAANWVAEQDQSARAIRLAWAARDRLSARDRAALIGYAGPRYPEPSSLAERLTAWEQAVAAAPDRAESWWMLGDQPLFHSGRLMGLRDWRERAATAFRRAVELDSGFVGPYEHLMELAIMDGDTAQSRRYAARYLALDSAGEVSDFVRWRAALATEDSLTLVTLRARFDQMNIQSLWRIAGTAQLDGLALNDAERATELSLRRAGTPGERGASYQDARSLAANGGRPAAARAMGDAWQQVRGWPHLAERLRVFDALYWDGDAGAAGEAARKLAASADAPLASRADARQTQYIDICIVEQWRLAHRELRTAGRSIAKLRTAVVPRDSGDVVDNNVKCVAILEAMLAAQEGRSDAAMLSRLDSVLRAGIGDWHFSAAGNLVVARLSEARGDVPRALEAVRRRPYFWGGDGTICLSTLLREEGRLAALTGDRQGAIRAYQHYLALRSDPEPAVKPEVERVRAELAKLLAER